METIKLDLDKKDVIFSSVFNIAAVSVVYFLPAISHLFSFPLYYIDPMRILILLSLVHTKKENAILLAITLPLFSFLISGHPVFAKSGLILSELLINVLLFVFLEKKVKNLFFAGFSSIIVSKAIYYVAKYFMISIGVINGNLFSTPVYIQLIMSLLFAGYIYIFINKTSK
ncbi:MAG TPA: hypothetical protein PL041_03810 [Melioribacteraceae bacterium]|nr:hypothetical protein [Melioribacteraceae bacterium]